MEGLSTANTEEEIRILFKDYGEITQVNMLNYRADLTGKCFVEFADAEMAS